MALRIVFAGSPDFAVVSLKALVDSNHQVVAVYTQPDRPAGRGRKTTPGAVKQVAVTAGIPVLQPVSLKGEQQQQVLAELKPDVMVVVAYGLLLPLSILDTPTHGCINVHASLLPRWRGAAPIQRAILAGDPVSGVTIMQMAQGLDTGPMLDKAETPIKSDDSGQSLHDRLADIGADALLRTLDAIEHEQLNPLDQDDQQASYAKKLNKAEALLDWSQSAIALERTVRAFNPWPVAHTLRLNKPLRIWQAQALGESSQAKPGTVLHQSKEGIKIATGEGILLLQTIQLAGKKAMEVKEFVNANSMVGECLG